MSSCVAMEVISLTTVPESISALVKKTRNRGTASLFVKRKKAPTNTTAVAGNSESTALHLYFMGLLY